MTAPTRLHPGRWAWICFLAAGLLLILWGVFEGRS